MIWTVLTYAAVIIGLACGALVLAAFVLVVIVDVNDKRYRANLSDHPSHVNGPPRVAP